MFKIITGMAIGALLTLTLGLVASRTPEWELASDADPSELEEERLAAAERLRATVDKIVQKEKEALEALKDDMNARMEAVHAAAITERAAIETPAALVSESPAGEDT